MALKSLLFAATGGALSIANPAGAQAVAEPSAVPTQIQEVVVTAQKRTESINNVGMSINAVGAAALLTAGVSDPSDLMRVIPGFTSTKTTDSIPVYNIRGIGYYDNNPSGTSAVTVYVDEVAIPFPIMTQGTTLDLERVEVLKGPQGTLFGQNSTGGAINFIDAKPTNTVKAGADLSYGRFNTLETEGYLSGPLTDTLKARVSARFERADGWQYSYTRPDSIGQVNRSAGRLILDWTPSRTFDAELNVNGWSDKSDSQMGQLVALGINNPGGQDPRLATGDGSPGNPFVQTYPAPPHNPRAADWTPGQSYASDNKYWQTSLRANLQLSDNVKLTSISSFQDLSFSLRTDEDGTSLAIIGTHETGFIRAYSEELRVSGVTERLHWMIGGNYFSNKEGSVVFGNYTNFSIPIGTNTLYSNTSAESEAGFVNADYQLTSQFSIQGGVRYTHYQERLTGCGADSGDGKAAGLFNFLLNTNVFQPGGCYSIDNIHYNPAVKLVVSPANDLLSEGNVSWRVDVNYKPTRNTLLYANISKGYKAGAHTLASANALSQYAAVHQESVIGVESGIKVSTPMMVVTAAAFYYAYQNKQLDAPFDTGPPFGVQDKLLNIPRSRIAGAEAGVTLLPLKGLVLNLNGTYISTRVLSHFSALDPFGNVVDIKDEAFPYTPKWQLVADGEYDFPLTKSLTGLVGASSRYRSTETAGFGSGVPFHSVFDINGYNLVDLRSGVKSSDDKWRIELWGRNITNQYYRLNTAKLVETFTALTGMPATYGIRLHAQY